MINTRILLKAMSFMFLPTVAILFFIFCAFFSWTLFVDFITSQNGWAIFVRIVMMLAEIVLVCYMYNYYIERDITERIVNDLTTNSFRDRKIKTISGDSHLYDITGNYSAKYDAYKSSIPNIIIIEKNP